MPLNVAQTDFDQIKLNLITHLKTHDDFLDYDFTGSALNILVDALAYATHYGVVYANLNINEMFLDTGIIRSSVVSKAKELGYIPKQYTSAKATVNLSVDMTGETIPSSIIVEEGIIFSGVNSDGENYRFIVFEETVLNNEGNDVFSGDVVLTEGQKITEQWTHDINDPKKIILSNDKVDTSTLNVTTKPFAGSSSVTNKINSVYLTNVDYNSEVFFVQETPQEKVEIYFGDGSLGKKIENNNVIEISYTKSNGIDANKISSFVLISDIDSISRSKFTITTVESASGGDNRESIASIKHIAPKAYQAQNRCVTKDDYIAIILRDNANIKSLNVWGGETEEPPKYGRFFISMKTVDGSELSPTKKSEILTRLKKFNVLTIIPEIIDPSRILINITSTVTYKSVNTSLTSSNIIAKVNTSINELFNNKIYDFGDTFRYSELLSVIDDTDTSIVSNNTKITLKDVMVTRTGEITREFTYANKIIPETLFTNEWTDDASRVRKISDVNGDGKLYTTVNGIVSSTSIGTINYDTGVVKITDFDFNIANVIITFTATPLENDVKSQFNTLLLQGDVNVTTVVGT